MEITIRCYGVEIDGHITGTANYEAAGFNSIKEMENLIATAPELLAALERLEKASEYGTPEEQEYAAKKARIAIAKAKG